MKTLFKLLVVSLIAATTLAGCSPQVELGAVINMFEGEDIPSLDVSNATDAVSFNSLGNVMEGLVRQGPVAGEMVAGVAESWTWDEASLTWTFALNKDAKWVNSAGEEQRAVTAADFVYSWDRVTTGEAYQYAFMITDVAKVVSYEAVDDSTFVVTLSENVPYFLNVMAFPTTYPIPAEAVEAAGDAYGTTAESVWYNGPFYMSEWTKSSQFIWTKNEAYWEADVVRTPAVTFRVIENYEVATGVELYDAGEIDRVGLSGEFVAQRKDDADAITVFDTAVFYLMFNIASDGIVSGAPVINADAGNPLFDNLKVRQAIAYQIEKSYITDEILKNGSVPAYHFVPSGYLSYEGVAFESARGEGYMLTDKAKAATLFAEGMAELGYAPGDNKLTVEVLNYESATAGLIIEYVVQELNTLFADYGITVNVTTLPFAEKLVKAEAGEFDITFAGWGPDYDWPTTYLDMWKVDNGYNEVGYNNPAYDALVSATGKTVAEAFADLQAAEGVLLNDVAILPIYQRAGVSLANPAVKDVYSHLSGYDFSYKWAYKEAAAE